MIRVKAAFFSMTAPPDPGDDLNGYLQWHLLDHMPEQYQLPGIVHATRWIAGADEDGHRIAGDGHLERIGSVMQYLVGDPVQQTHDDFMELGYRLGEAGRFPERRPSLQITMPALLHWYAAPRAQVSAEVVPFRPHRGVLLIVEEPGGDPAQWLQWTHAEHHPELLQAPGVAGVWLFGSTNFWRLDRQVRRDRQYVTVVYLDGDPLRTTKEVTPLIERRWASGAVRPLFAGPMRSMIRWDAWPDA